MDKKVLTLTAVVGAVSVGTYALLTVVKPHQHEIAHVADVYSADAMFQGKEDPNGPDETPTNPAPAAQAAAATPAPAEAAPAAEATTATATPTSTETATASGDAMATPTEPGVAPEAAAPAPTQQAAAAPPAPAEPAAAAPAPAPVEQPAAAPAPAPVETAAAAAEPAPTPAPKPKHHTAKKKKATHSEGSNSSSTSASASAVPPPASTAISAWWPAQNPAQLSMVYAGPASFKKAIVLLFNADFASADSANASIKVIDTKGNPVTPAWELGATNKRMLVLPVNEGGYYKVTVGADLADGNQRKLGAELSGDVIIR